MMPTIALAPEGESRRERGALLRTCVEDGPNRGRDRSGVARIDEAAAAGLANDGRHAREVRRDDGHVRRDRLEQLVRCRQAVVQVVGWIGIAATSADATHSMRSAGGTAGRTAMEPLVS